MLLAVTTAPVAQAAPPTDTQGAPKATVIVDPTEAALIIGGRTQSKDPTGLTYVPAAGTGVTPAYASGQAFISAFTYTWGGFSIPVPGGFLTHTIWGSGLFLSEESASYMPTPVIGPINLCNWRIDWQSRAGSTVYSTSQGVLHGCSWAGYGASRDTTPRGWAKQSSMCARIYISLTYRGEQCHNIVP